MKPLLLSTVAVSLLCSSARAQEVSGVPVQMVVTAEPFQGSAMPAISSGDVAAWQGRTSVPVTGWVPLTGDKAGLELYILIDERVDPAQVALFDRLRRFVSDQPPSTAVGIAYMFNGEARIAQTPTTDHALAAKALRVSSGSESAEASPYVSLSALVNGWGRGEAPRREVLAVTDGIDRFGDFGDLNTYVDAAVADAQRAGVLVYCLYAPSLGHSSHSPALIRWGQSYLGRLGEQTGGETYLSGSLDVYLADLSEHLAHQYLATFRASRSGEPMQEVRFTTRFPNVDLLAAYRFALPGLSE
jgi:hypothetical protein